MPLFSKSHLSRLTALLLAFSASGAYPGIVEGKPDAIVCSVKDPVGALPWEQLVFYVSAHTRNGDTLYKSATSDPVVLLVSAEGIVNGANLADCDGRNVESLFKDNRAFNFSSGSARQSRK